MNKDISFHHDLVFATPFGGNLKKICVMIQGGRYIHIALRGKINVSFQNPFQRTEFYMTVSGKSSASAEFIF
jgi:hypothetical protein